MQEAEFETAVADLAQAIGLVIRRMRAAAATDELSWTDYAVLKRLAKSGPATTAELARAQGMRPQSMRPILAVLEEMGLVERQPHATDGRQVNIALTEKGAEVQKRAGDARRTWLAQAIARLDERDQERLFGTGEIMRRLVEGDGQ